MSLELGPAEGTGRQPEPGTFLFCFVFSGCCGGPFARVCPSLHRAAAVTREPQPWSTRREGRLPYPIGVAAHAAAAASRCLAPARALRTRPRLWPGDLGAEPGTATPDCACLRWAVCFWDFSKADGVRGPLSPGDSDSIGSWPLTGHTHDL